MTSLDAKGHWLAIPKSIKSYNCDSLRFAIVQPGNLLLAPIEVNFEITDIFFLSERLKDSKTSILRLVVASQQKPHRRFALNNDIRLTSSVDYLEKKNGDVIGVIRAELCFDSIGAHVYTEVRIAISIKELSTVTALKGRGDACNLLLSIFL